MTTLPYATPSRPFVFDGVVRLTRIGTTYLILTIVIGFAALNTGNNALYIGLTFMLASLLLSGIASKGGLKHLDAQLGGLESAWAGRPADAIVRLSNRSRIWNVRDIVIAAPDLAEPVLVPILTRRSSVEVTASFVFQRRGRVELKTVDLYTRYPFGLFLKKRRVSIGSEVVVFPRLLQDSSVRERFRPSSGEQSSAKRPGPGTEIHSFREFVRGDSLRQVHWKKSASLGRWIIKQTDREAARSVHVAVDPYRPRAVTPEAFEEMISAATTFVHEALRRGLDVVLVLPRVTLRAREYQSADPLFRALALLEESHEPVAQSIDRETVLFSLSGGQS